MFVLPLVTLRLKLALVRWVIDIETESIDKSHRFPFTNEGCFLVMT